MNKVGLYLHVPFCGRKCRYCDFYSLEETEKRRAYADKVLSLLPLYRERLGDRAVDTVYIGGGTPSLLSPASLEAILDGIRTQFTLTPDAEITAEANPESLSGEVLAAYRSGGVNRVSLGMQSAHDGELAMLGRIHTAAQTKDAVARAHQAGFENISLDLMYALPDQTADSFFQSVDTAVSYGIQHLSLYCLTLSEKAPLYARKDDLPDEETQRAMYLGAVDRAEKAGLKQYEISNFARPGFASRHNLRYWRREAYLGIGPGAWSYLDGERFGALPSLDRFLRAADPAELIGEREKVDRAVEIEEEIILSLRLTEGLSARRLAALAGEERALAVMDRLAALESAGLTCRTKEGFRLTARGFFVSNRILADLI
ncbi:MAG: radical SAM family heme chaperone HemW [Clostridia bacterium]|nr:radical SAM family heme chaperone HemW [Clostridia bacterium]